MKGICEKDLKPRTKGEIDCVMLMPLADFKNVQFGQFSPFRGMEEQLYNMAEAEIAGHVEIVIVPAADQNAEAEIYIEIEPSEEDMEFE